MDIEIDRQPTDSDINALREKLIAYNVARHGHTEVAKAGIFIRNDDGSLAAGISAYAWGGCMEVELLWVADDRRGEGLGTRLMDAVEEEARRVGCSLIYLDTFSYQAPEFYKKRGFEVAGIIEDFPEGHSHYTLFKKL